jgi:hypothetical protein
MENKKFGEEEQQYCSAQSVIYHNHCLGDNDSHAGHVSTVPGTYLEWPSRLGVHSRGIPRNYLQLPSLAGPPAWDESASCRIGEGHGHNLPSQIEFHRDSDVEDRNNDIYTAFHPNSDCIHSSLDGACSSGDDRDPSSIAGSRMILANIANVGTQPQQMAEIPEWDGCNLDYIIE